MWRQHQRSKRSIRNEVQVLKSALDEYEADDSEKVLILNWYDTKEIMVQKRCVKNQCIFSIMQLG